MNAAATDGKLWKLKKLFMVLAIFQFLIQLLLKNF
jgi:hypothetical protein